MKPDLRHWAQRHPERQAIEIGAQALNYRELEAQVNRLTHVFKRLGSGAGNAPVATSRWMVERPRPVACTTVGGRANSRAGSAMRVVIVSARFLWRTTGVTEE